MGEITRAAAEYDPETPARTTRLPGSERRAVVLNAAIECFAGSGYFQTTMDDIAKTAGVTKPVIYQHFRSKRELYTAILLDIGEDMNRAVADASSRYRTPQDTFRAGFEAYFRFVYEHRSAYELIFAASPRRDPEFRIVVTSIEDRIAEAIASRISVDLDEYHRDLVASGMLALAEGIARRYIREQPAEVLPDGARVPFDQSNAFLWTMRMSDLMWAGLRGLQRSPLQRGPFTP